jgi:ATP-binding cassette, subfamily B, multidrug efflux pump
MRLRWNFHRLMLEQSLAFYGDEFAGRIATKVMQTALAVRDTWLIFADILVYVVIYFVTMVAIVGGFDAWLMLPFLGWLALYMVTLWFFVPRLGRWPGAGRRALADDRPHHRRLHQHRHRQAVLARAPRGRLCPRRDAGVHGHGLPQMRLVTGFETSTSCSRAAGGSTAGAALCCGCRARWVSGRWPRPPPWPSA